MANSEQIVNFLGQIVYDEELQGADQAVKDEFRELQQAKLDMIRRKVMTDLISQRLRGWRHLWAHVWKS